jgi:hypothetical protein
MYMYIYIYIYIYIFEMGLELSVARLNAMKRFIWVGLFDIYINI